jgi:heptosyltransferase-1
MKILIVKLSSLGDVVHTMPAVMDVQAAFPNAQIDWVVERSFAPLVQRCEAVHRVIACDLRQWRKKPFASSTHQAWRLFKQELQLQDYDAVIDLQGLTKSAWVSWLAKTSSQGKRYALGHQTDGSGYEAPTRWVADQAIDVERHIHAINRSRVMCAKALGYSVPAGLRYGLSPSAAQTRACVALVHGTSRADKEWPVSHWLELGRRLHAQGFQVVLPHGNAVERQRSEQLAQALPDAVVWPTLSLDALTAEMASCAGVIGVDSGLSHIAVALDLPHVQIYNFDTAWRTGPIDLPRQRSVFAQPTPDVDAVWQAWLKVCA